MSDDYSKMTAPRASDEIHRGVEADQMMKPGADGLPAPVPRPNFDIPPGLSPENLICMADTRSFVVRDDYGRVLAEFRPEEVEQLPTGRYVIQKIKLAPELNAKLDDHANDEYIWLSPVRPACEFYLRQLTDLTADRESRFMQRACLRQRSETGEYMSVRDDGLYACSMREPRHLPSEQQLDDFDNRKMKEASDKAETQANASTFDVDAELAKENLGVLGG